MPKICFVGGGTMGSVSPLLAVRSELSSISSNRQAFLNSPEFIWIGTKNGPERRLIEFKYYDLPEAKLKRYFCISNFVLPAALLYSFIKSICIIMKERPSLIMGAGSYLTVPVVIAGKLFGIPSIIHQQDLRPSLSNQVLKHFATLITTTFKKSFSNFPEHKTVWTGNPVRRYLFKESVTEENMVLVMGGGTGSKFINRLVLESIGELTKIAYVVHITGRGKSDLNSQIKNYAQFEFLDKNMGEFLQKSRVVVCRAGLSTLTELAHLKKPSIIIPLPLSHQEDNAGYIKKNNGAVVLEQSELDKNRFVREVKKLMENKEIRTGLGKNLSDLFSKNANEKMTEVILRILDGNR